MSFNGIRNPTRERMIQEQVAYVTTNANTLCGDEFLFHDPSWSLIEFKRFALPQIWQAKNGGKQTTPLMIAFPDQYPDIPPVGFYMPETLNAPEQARRVYDPSIAKAHGVPTDFLANFAGKGWKWFCMFFEPGRWNPARIRYTGDWQHGDNLATYINAIGLVLTDPS